MRLLNSRWIIAVALSMAGLVACGDSIGSTNRVVSIRIVSAPMTIEAGESFSVTVELRGPSGEIATGVARQVSLALASPGSAVLAGPTLVVAENGVATFGGLSIETAAEGLQFVAVAGSLAAAGPRFTVAAGAFVPGKTTLLPAAGNVPPNADTELTLTFSDEFGNPAAGLPIALSTNSAGATFTPALGTSSPSGQFVTRFHPVSAGPATINVSADGVLLDLGAPYTVVDLCPGPVAMVFPGNANGTQPCGAYLATSDAPSWYSFAAPGGGAAFTITSGFPLTLEVGAAPGWNSLSFAAEEPPATAEWLLPPGPYVLGVRSISGSGSFALAGAVSTGNSAGVPRALVASGEYEGQSFGPGDLTFASGSFADVYFFVSQHPCRITVRPTAGFRPFLRVADAVTGELLAPDKLSGFPGLPAVTSLAACRGGTSNPIVIVASTVLPGTTGGYVLVVESPLSLPPGAAISMRSERAGTREPVPVRIRDIVDLLRGSAPRPSRR